MPSDEASDANGLVERVETFMDEVIIPTEIEHLGKGPVSRDVIEDLRDEARDRNIYVPQIEREYGGMGLNFREALPAFVEAGRSLLGPEAMGIHAPDEGNMHLLELVGTESQKEKWLKPLVAGEIRSAFSMTEPMQGGGSDPKMLKTTAEKNGDEWVLNGHKWWTSQGVEADVYIVMARTDLDAHPYSGTSLFLVPADASGVEVVRSIPHLGPNIVHQSHAEIRYDNMRIPEENLLGNRNEGFTHAQERLGPARLTHCMRYSGTATRALNVAKAYARERELFGSQLSDKQAVRHTIADLEIRLHAVQTMVRDAAQRIADGEDSRIPVSMCKVFGANVCQNAIDYSIQVCGGAGMSRDLPLVDFYESVRAFRIVDGADEVHRRTIAREAFESATDPAIENIPQY